MRFQKHYPLSACAWLGWWNVVYYYFCILHLIEWDGSFDAFRDPIAPCL